MSYCKECKTCRNMDTKSCNSCCNLHGDTTLKDNYVSKVKYLNRDNYFYKDVLINDSSKIDSVKSIDVKISTFGEFTIDKGHIIVTSKTFNGVDIKLTMRIDVAEFAARNIFKCVGKRKKPKKEKNVAT